MYETLGVYYDKFMRGVDRGAWAEYLAGLIGARRRGLDVGCGTGAMTVELSRRGYAMTGADSSAVMLTGAAENARAAGENIDFILCDAQKIVLPRGTEFVTACCDVVNYLARPLGFFRRVYEGLPRGGAFMFDVSSAYKLMHVLAGRTFTDEADGVTYIWENAAGKGYVDIKLTFFAPAGDNKYTRATECQRQYAHDAETLLKLLVEAGFTAKAYGFLTRRPPKAEEERIQFTAYKE